jgi:hypothetical protein
VTSIEVIDSTGSSASDQVPGGTHDVIEQTDDAETRVVPAALAAFVAAARAAGAAMEHNGAYSATAATTAVCDVLGVLVPMAKQIAPYVGDYSGPGGAAMERAHKALTTAYAEAVDAQAQVSVGEAASDATPAA